MKTCAAKNAFTHVGTLKRPRDIFISTFTDNRYKIFDSFTVFVTDLLVCYLLDVGRGLNIDRDPKILLVVSGKKYGHNYDFQKINISIH